MTTDRALVGGPGPGPAGSRPGTVGRGLTVRARVLAAVLGLAALGMLVSGATAYLLQRDRVDELIDEALARNVEEFRTLAAQGIDPSTGERFTTASRLLYTALQRTVPSTDEGMLAVVDGQVAWVAAAPVAVRLEEVPELVDAAARSGADATVRLRTLTADGRSYRFATVPVRVGGDPQAGVLLLAFDREAQHAELVRTYRTYALVAAGSLLVLGVVGWVVAGRLLSPIRLLRETAQRITDSDLSGRIPVTGDDDLSDLARTSNAMLDRLEAAFAAQRRLLDDAGHELRTPLTIVRGHLELMDVGDAEEVAATRTLVLDEVDRMHGLVDDLVTLATVDRPDFVQPRAVDVGRLTDDVLDKARALGSQRWRVVDRADVVALLDERRLTQAMLQLAANAAKFAPSDSLVRIGSRVHGDRLRLTVEDEGPGVPAEDAERIFDRFARGGAGRGVQGSGLGLPIVAAIAAAHGGTAFVTEAGAGRGAIFVIDLPWRRPTTDEEEDR